ncbi:inositol monophosphatase family protein [Raineyella sp. W15-4]|uniref:inositol monophosphatase family protein n=1 Tax=Raineyella sp. W15-4 TaxID=3081651 RepID=UPI002955D4AB|nr:inositol monophosphatase family protein [Raineyella sp. W15-4]WOQ16694.1 inositol monophosphatase family protein [Raineyella sp. W15-4]
MTTAAVTELHHLALTVAEEGARMAKEMRDAGVAIADRKSSVADIVTEADRAVETAIRDAIARARPQDGFLGEETDRAGSASGLTWVVDPIDGTVNYAYGIPSWAVSVAVVEGDPDPATWTGLAGIVVNPAAGETWEAFRGGGARLNGRPLHVSRDVDLPRTLVGTGFGYLPERRMAQARVVTRLLGTVRDIRRAGAASLDICSVAAERLDAYYEVGLHPWDLGGGTVVALEAGAHVSGLRGAGPGESFYLACNPVIAGPLEELLIAAGAEPLAPATE